MKIILSLILLCSAYSIPTNAKEFKGVNFADEITVADTKLKLNGVGVRKAYEMFDVYVAGLYAAEISTDPEKILAQKTPKKLIMHFKRYVEKTKVLDAWNEGFFKNAPKTYNYRPDLNKLTEAMVHMKEDDVISITFLSDKAEVQILNNAPVIIPSSEFSNTMLKVFISIPPDERLKKGLLGK